MSNPTLKTAGAALRALGNKDEGLYAKLYKALSAYRSKDAAKSAGGKTAGNAALLIARGKGEPFAAWAGAIGPAFALPPATVDANFNEDIIGGLSSGSPIGEAAKDAVTGAVGDAVTAATPQWASGLVGAFTSGNTWLRVGEVVLGLLLVVAGVVKLAGPAALSATPVGRIAKAVR
jgi:hypothetical protein